MHLIGCIIEKSSGDSLEIILGTALWGSIGTAATRPAIRNARPMNIVKSMVGIGFLSNWFVMDDSRVQVHILWKRICLIFIVEIGDSGSFFAGEAVFVSSINSNATPSVSVFEGGGGGFR